MTCIAWDGKTLAADKRVEYVGLARTVTKIFRFNNELLGISGNGAQGNEMIEWYKAGAKPAAFPPKQRERDDWASLIVIRECGVFYYERTPHPCLVEDKIMAWGCGRDYALAAMHLGKTAREAVEIASVFDINCGNGEDELSLSPPRSPGPSEPTTAWTWTARSRG